MGAQENESFERLVKRVYRYAEEDWRRQREWALSGAGRTTARRRTAVKGEGLASDEARAAAEAAALRIVRGRFTVVEAAAKVLAQTHERLPQDVFDLLVVEIGEAFGSDSEEKFVAAVEQAKSKVDSYLAMGLR